MPKRVLPFIAVGLAIIVTVIYAFKPYLPEAESVEEVISEENSSEAPEEVVVTTPIEPNPTSQEFDGELEQQAALIQHVQKKFGPTIENKHTQVKAIEKMVAYLKQKYPENWESMLKEFLALAFPDRAPELILLHKNMDEYNRWVTEERHNLSKLSPQERTTLLWEMRLSFFGEAAKDIWSESLKNERIASSLAEITMPGSQTSVENKAKQYADTIKDVFGDQSEKVLEKRRQELVDRFLTSNEVQTQLNQLETEERYETLTQIRRTLGMDDAAISRWTELDKKRDDRWAKGKEYMAQRELLAVEYEGTELENRLRPIQNEMFGPEASIIRNEEAAGYFRYNEKQIIGQN